MSDAQVDSFFAESVETPKFGLEVVENSLLPTSEYFTEFPDSIRQYLNETETLDPDVRLAVELETPEFLRNQGIDLRNKTVTVPYMRETIMNKLRVVKYH